MLKNFEDKAYGYVNGKAVYSRDEFIFEKRGFGPIESDDELMAYAEKVTWGWQDAGWRQKFTHFYLSDYALSEPCASLMRREFDRLKELQKQARAAHDAAEAAREWRKTGTLCWADNSIEEVWVDKNGIEKRVMVVGPHGDVC